MRSILEWTFSVWKMYWDEGFYQYLLILSVLYLLLFHRKKAAARQVLPYFFLILITFFCPVSAVIIRKCIGTSVYWRVLWLVPVIPIIALAGTEFIRRWNSRLFQIGLIILFTIAVSFCGKTMFQKGYYEKLANNQKVPNEVAVICNLLEEKAQEQNLPYIRIAADEYLACYIRVYDASILMPYGRWGKGILDKESNRLYNQINSDNPRFKVIAESALTKECNFLALPHWERDPHEVLARRGYEEIGTAGSYTIYQLR